MKAEPELQLWRVTYDYREVAAPGKWKVGAYYVAAASLADVADWINSKYGFNPKAIERVAKSLEVLGEASRRA